MMSLIFSYCQHAFYLKINKKTKQYSLVCLVCPGWTVCGISSIAKCVPKWHAWKVSLVIFARNLGSQTMCWLMSVLVPERRCDGWIKEHAGRLWSGGVAPRWPIRWGQLLPKVDKMVSQEGNPRFLLLWLFTPNCIYTPISTGRGE